MLRTPGMSNQRPWFDHIVYGTQYYRAPTPRPDEWEADLEKAAAANLEAIQLRVQWRWHERRKEEFYHDDNDRLFDLAEKYGLKVIVKFLMENAPEWLYREYNCHRVDNQGTIIPGGAAAAYYVGGWVPCFDHPGVREEGTRFVSTIVDRYKDREALIAWNAWNEPVVRPFGECCCRHSQESLRNWLRGQWKTIEAFNAFTGKAWGDWEEVSAPRLYSTARTLFGSDFADLYFWKKWAMWACADRVKWIYDAVKAHDTTRPCYAHVGGASILQIILAFATDDRQVAEGVDYYGSSLASPLVSNGTPETPDYDRGIWNMSLVCDWMRAVSPDYWINEIYNYVGRWPEKNVTDADLYYRNLLCVAHGAKGLVYWQFHMERLGSESEDCGFVTIAGEATERLDQAGKIGAFLKEHGKALREATVPPADVTIVYDVSCDLLAAIQHAFFTGADCNQHLDSPYKVSLRGLYLHLWHLGLTVDFVDGRDHEKLRDAKVVFLPYAIVLTEPMQEALRKFVANGGVLVSDPCPGLREENTWVSPRCPPPLLQEVFGCRQIGYVYQHTGRTFVPYKGSPFKVRGGVAEFGEPGPEAKVIATWPDGAPAAVENRFGKGKAFLLGFQPGCHAYGELKRWLKRLTKKRLGLRSEWSTETGQGEVRRLAHPNGDFLFFFNPEDNENTFSMRWKGDPVPDILWGRGSVTAKNKSLVATLPPYGILVGRCAHL